MIKFLLKLFRKDPRVKQCNWRQYCSDHPYAAGCRTYDV